MRRRSKLPAAATYLLAAAVVPSLIPFSQVTASDGLAGGRERAQRRSRLERDYRQALSELAARAEQQGFSARAERAAQWRPPRMTALMVQNKKIKKRMLPIKFKKPSPIPKP